MPTDRPLTHDELRKMRPVEALGRAPARSIWHSFYVSSAGRDPPEVTTSIEEMSPVNGGRVFRIDVKASPELRDHPPIMSRKTHTWKDFSKTRHIKSTKPQRPDFVPVNYLPFKPPASKIGTRPQLVLKGNPMRPLDIFPPDRRQQLFDQSYPWCTVGQTISPVGNGTDRVGTGTLVGPRHVLTASHCISWNAPGGPSLLFTPSFSGGSQPPFGQSWGIEVYDYRQIDQPQDQIDVSEDYAVVVLDQRLGDNIGWLGTRTYTTDWDNQSDWFNIGYPEDLGGGQIPFWQGQVSFEDADNPGIFGQEGPGLYMNSETCSLDHGNSGGPFFAFWDQNADHPGWHIVSVASAEGTLDWTFDDDNWASGGNPMVQLVSQAQSDFP